jgi:hypothetical protein
MVLNIEWGIEAIENDNPCQESAGRCNDRYRVRILDAQEKSRGIWWGMKRAERYEFWQSWKHERTRRKLVADPMRYLCQSMEILDENWRTEPEEIFDSDGIIAP